MITIRLQRRGRANDPSFRVIVTDSKKAPQSGKYLEMVGSYDPRTDRVELKSDRIQEWIEHGAKLSGTVHNLLVSQKILSAKKINVLPKKTPPAIEKAEAPAQVASAPASEAAEAASVVSDAAHKEAAAKESVAADE
ncbi:MAG: 30S ribosomal protein S16 [Minisyncoccia bacterium]